MKTQVVSTQLKESLERKQLSQTQLAQETHRAKTTINGYFNGGSTPAEAMIEIAEVMDDSLLSQHFSSVVFESIPAMETDIYIQSPHTLDIIQLMESEERKHYKTEAMYILTRHKNTYTAEDKQVIAEYAMNFLDEVFVEIRYIISLLDKLDLSLMAAVRQRKSHWIKQGYIRR